jgi:hypothetical protein
MLLLHYVSIYAALVSILLYYQFATPPDIDTVLSHSCALLIGKELRRMYLGTELLEHLNYCIRKWQCWTGEVIPPALQKLTLTTFAPRVTTILNQPNKLTNTLHVTVCTTMPACCSGDPCSCVSIGYHLRESQACVECPPLLSHI